MTARQNPGTPIPGPRTPVTSQERPGGWRVVDGHTLKVWHISESDVEIKSNLSVQEQRFHAFFPKLEQATEVGKRKQLGNHLPCAQIMA